MGKTEKVMKLLDASTGLMQCRVCGKKHIASVRPRSKGAYQKGSWQCTNGCELPEKKQ